jgi:cytochrome b
VSEAAKAEPPGRTPVLVWDAPTRIAHWLLALLIPLSWWSAEVAHRLDWHRLSGYTIIGVIVFRLYWGFFGGETARFSHFLRGPGAIADYVRGRSPERLGHNPIGALSVLAMIVMLFVQVGLGLFAVDIDGLESGPLSDRVTFDQGRLAAELHEISFNILLALIALHLAAIVFYAVRRNNLLGPMITGRRSFDGEGMRSAPLWQLVIGVALAAGVAWLVSKGLRI